MSRNAIKVLMGLFVAVVFGMAGCGGGGETAQNNRETAANAGPAQNVVAGSLVTLNGSQSTGADGNLITYQWTMTSKPVESVATITNPTTVNPTFTPDLPGQYSLKLVITDTKSVNSEAIVTITASVANAAPVANAGAAQSVVTGAVVTLDGSASSDANGDMLTYSWAFTSKPAGSSAVLSSTTVVMPTFTADVAGAYVLNLVVNDGKANSAAATVTIIASVANAAPVANAGAAQSVVTGAVVTLDGSASSDANGDLLTYIWAFTSKPTGSSAALSSATVAKPTFTADGAGVYILNLVVNDGKVSSVAATVAVTAIPPDEWITPTNAVASNSTVWGGTWYTGTPEFAIDSNNITAWTYNGMGSITFDLGDNRTLKGINAYWGGSVSNGNNVNVYVDGVKVLLNEQFGATTNIRYFTPVLGRYVMYETVALPHNEYLQIATWSEIAEFKVFVAGN